MSLIVKKGFLFNSSLLASINPSPRKRICVKPLPDIFLSLYRIDFQNPKRCQRPNEPIVDCPSWWNRAVHCTCCRQAIIKLSLSHIKMLTNWGKAVFKGSINITIKIDSFCVGIFIHQSHTIQVWPLSVSDRHCKTMIGRRYTYPSFSLFSMKSTSKDCKSKP